MARYSHIVLPFILSAFFILNALQSNAQIHVSALDVGAVRLSHPGNFFYQIGAMVEGIGDIDGDGFKEAAIGAPSFDPGGDLGLETQNGAVFIVSGKMLQHDQTSINLSDPASIAWSIIGHQNSQIGSKIAALGDINGDGFDDFSFSSLPRSESYVMFGGEVIPRVLPLNEFGDYGVVIKDTGHGLNAAGDFNGDGFFDAALGRPSAPGQPDSPGQFALMYGKSAFPKEMNFEQFPSIKGLPNTHLGEFIDSGFDLTADGYSDLLVSEPTWGNQEQGRVFIIEGAESHQEDFKEGLKTPLVFESIRGCAKTVYDVNGDGFVDFLLGDDGQEAWLVLGRPGFEGRIDRQFLENDPLSIRLVGDATFYGVHDVDGDGFAELAVGMPNETVNGKALVGQVMILFGNAEWPNEINLALFEETSDIQLRYILIDGLASEEFGLFGASIAGIEDVQGDGFDDIIIGAPTVSDPSGLNIDRPGSAYVIQGRNIYFITQTERSQFFTRNSD